jgi:hypothetical protein
MMKNEGIRKRKDEGRGSVAFYEKRSIVHLISSPGASFILTDSSACQQIACTIMPHGSIQEGKYVLLRKIEIKNGRDRRPVSLFSVCCL